MTALQGLVNFCEAVATRRGARFTYLLPVLAAASLPLIAGVSAPASAGPAPVPFIYNWSGFYVGLNGGAGGGPVSPLYNITGLAQPGYPGDQRLDEQHHRMGGFSAGLQAGYNRQFGNVVLGIESDFQWSNIGAQNSDNTHFNYDIGGGYPIGGYNFAGMWISQNWFGTTRLRAGYAFDHLLVYVTGGVAYSNFSIGNSAYGSEFFPNPANYVNIASAVSSTRLGFAAGAGLEVALSSRVSLKSEYLYTSYPGLSATYVDHEGSNAYVSNGTFSTGPLNIHLVRAGFNYHLQDGEQSVGPYGAMAAWTPSWTGFYAGVNGGYGAGTLKPNQFETSLNVVNLFPGTTSEVNSNNIDSRLRSGGFEAGVQLGYNRELPNRFVAGIETDLQWSGIRGSRASALSETFFYNPLYPGDSITSLSVNQNWFGTTRLRLGYRPTDRLLAYATGGIAYSGFSAGLSRSFFDSIDGPALGSWAGWRGTTRLGWAAGAGVEYALWRNVSFKTEYLYTQYAGFSTAYQGADTDNNYYLETTHGTLSTGTIGIHLVRGGFNWKFGE
jgi:outer membrane immunogenic protein